MTDERIDPIGSVTPEPTCTEWRRRPRWAGSLWGEPCYVRLGIMLSVPVCAPAPGVMARQALMSIGWACWRGFASAVCGLLCSMRRSIWFVSAAPGLKPISST